jgi:hypothetical protein
MAPIVSERARPWHGVEPASAHGQERRPARQMAASLHGGTRAVERQ